MKKKIFLLSLLMLFFVQPVLAADMDIRDEIFYDLLIDRFNIGNHDLSEQVRQDDPFAYHGGDFLGIINKLDRIEELGYTAIILSPIQKNAKDGYHGYWIEDFYEVNEEFGTLEDLKTLVEEANKRNIKVLLEMVVNYVAESHPFVLEDVREDWFITRELQPTEATFWLDHVAALNQEHPDVEEYLIEVAKYWMTEVDFAGFKIHDADQASRTFLENYTSALKEEDPNFYILAGVSDKFETLKSNFLKEIPSIDGVENYELFEQLNEVFTEVGEPVAPLYEQVNEGEKPQDILFIDHKNSARFANNFSEKGRETITTWQLAFTYLYTRPGLPVIFQGSELPMYGPSFKESQQLVRFNATNPDIEEFHNRITSLRKEFKALTHGDFEYIDSSGGLSVIKRTYENETMYVAINNDHMTQTLVIPDLEPNQELRGFLADDLVRETRNGEYRISIPRESVEVYLLRPYTGFNWVFILPISSIMIIFIAAMIYLSIKERRDKESQETTTKA